MHLAIKGLTIPPQHEAEYEAAAKHYVENDELPKFMPPNGALVYIFANPDAFLERVAKLKHAAAFQARQGKIA